jgi:parallel beta-helix repeat protein
VLLIVPIVISASVFTVLSTDVAEYWVARQAAERMETHNWKTAATTMEAAQPDYRRKFAYYRVKTGQTLPELASYFGTSEENIRRLNKGSRYLPGSTIRIPPVERPMQPVRSTRTIAAATVVLEGDIIRVIQDYDRNSPIRTNIPELGRFLETTYDAIDRVAPRTYRIKRPIQLDGDIRLDVTDDSGVSKVELVSTSNTIAPLLFDGGSALFQNVEITSVDPRSGNPDASSKDGRAYVRMKNGRMDSVGSTFAWLGNGLPYTLTEKAQAMDVESEGGTYGFSYRISSDALGIEVATGWVSGSTFDQNHFGAYTYGTSGMMWKDNLFTNNEVYGLDPHDDSNNAMVVGNRFLYNGKHGFIVSKRCNYNVITNNTSVGNKLHGFMLHQDSAYNVIENNVAYHNGGDNFAIFQSSWNTIRNNRSYIPVKAHFRVNARSHHNYIVDNKAFGGNKGAYLYDDVSTTYVSGNEFNDVNRPLQTKGAKSTFFGRTTVKSYNYDIQPGDTVIFGSSRIRKAIDDIPERSEVETGDFAD